MRPREPPYKAGRYFITAGAGKCSSLEVGPQRTVWCIST